MDSDDKAPGPLSQAALTRKAREMKQAAQGAAHPDGGATAKTGAGPTPSGRATVKLDKREAGRVSAATKQSQARRDSRPK